MTTINLFVNLSGMILEASGTSKMGTEIHGLCLLSYKLSFNIAKSHDHIKVLITIGIIISSYCSRNEKYHITIKLWGNQEIQVIQ